MNNRNHLWNWFVIQIQIVHRLHLSDRQDCHSNYLVNAQQRRMEVTHHPAPSSAASGWMTDGRKEEEEERNARSNKNVFSLRLNALWSVKSWTLVVSRSVVLCPVLRLISQFRRRNICRNKFFFTDIGHDTLICISYLTDSFLIITA